MYRKSRYLLDEFLFDLNCGHNIVGTIFVECGAMYRADGPAELASVGETEFANGVAAMSASGLYGTTQVCVGIVGHADLRLGDDVEGVLCAHMSAAGSRLRGVRQVCSHDPDPDVLGPLSKRVAAGLYGDADFRRGFAALERLSLSFDALFLEPQMDDVLQLAKAFPGTNIIANHVGIPLGVASYRGTRENRFPTWRQGIRRLAECPNVYMKLGGLGMPFAGFPWSYANRPVDSAEIAAAWRPYIEACVEAFGPSRCMFESNFPIDSFSCEYKTVWDAYKIVSKQYSPKDVSRLFSETAKAVYKMQI